MQQALREESATRKARALSISGKTIWKNGLKKKKIFVIIHSEFQVYLNHPDMKVLVGGEAGQWETMKRSAGDILELEDMLTSKFLKNDLSILQFSLFLSYFCLSIHVFAGTEEKKNDWHDKYFFSKTERDADLKKQNKKNKASQHIHVTLCWKVSRITYYNLKYFDDLKTCCYDYKRQILTK